MSRNTTSAAQLWLVKPTPQPQAQDPARRLFDHWVFMLGKPSRTQFGPTRRQAVNAWLKVYDLDTLLLAVEGCASDPWACGDNRLGREFNDLLDILKDEARIERYASLGERVRAESDAADAGAAGGEHDAPADAVSPEEAAAAREKLRAIAARMSGRGGAAR